MKSLAWGLAGLALALQICGDVLLVASDRGRLDVVELVLLVDFAAFAVIGALVASRHRRNPIGWICVGVGLAAGLSNVAAAYVALRLDGSTDPGALAGAAAVYEETSWLAFVIVPVTFLLMLFPDGHLLSRRWRPVAWWAALGISVSFVSLAAAAKPPAPLRNPVAVEGALVNALTTVGVVLMLAGVLGSVAGLFVRYRRAAHGQRQQIKWLAAAGALLAVVSPLDAALESTLGDWAYTATVLSLTGLPLAVGIAILRHRLYDIDVVINRALVYATLTASAAASYVCGVLVLQLALSPLTQSSNLAIAGSTLAVAALFRPARRRIQALVDRRFFRSRYDAQRTLERFGARVRNEVDLDALADELRAVVADTMAPEHVTVWLRASETRR